MKKSILLFVSIFLIAGSSFSQAKLVKDINPGSEKSHFVYTWMVSVNELLIFSADDGIHGQELWISDGTEDGTQLLKDINPGSEDSDTDPIVVHKGLLFFSADDGMTGDELWVTDGTTAGTYLVKDINPGSESSTNRTIGAVSMDDFILFTASEGESYHQLWRSDGTEPNTNWVADICDYCDLFNIPAEVMVELNGKAYFFSDQNLYESDGTELGTKVIFAQSNNPNFSFPEQLAKVNGLLYFRAGTFSDVGEEPWVSDGTTAGTKLLKDLNDNDDDSSYPEQFTYFDDYVYFLANEALYRTDGTEAGTEVFYDEKPCADDRGNTPDYLHTTDNYLFFVALDQTVLEAFLSATTGTMGDVVHLKRIGQSLGTILYKEDLHNILYFPGAKPPSRFNDELFSTDGTVENTVLAADINPSNFDSSDPEDFAVVDDKLYFFADDGDHGKELWEYRPPTVSFDHLRSEPVIKVWPSVWDQNTRHFQIQTSASLVRISLSDQHGKEVWQYRDAATHQVAGSNLFNVPIPAERSSGIYWLIIETKYGQIVTQPIVVQ